MAIITCGGVDLIHDPETVRLVGLRTDGNSEIVHDNPVHRAVEDQRIPQVGMTDLVERAKQPDACFDRGDGAGERNLTVCRSPHAVCLRGMIAPPTMTCNLPSSSPDQFQEYGKCPWVILGRSVRWFESRAA